MNYCQFEDIYDGRKLSVEDIMWSRRKSWWTANYMWFLILLFSKKWLKNSWNLVFTFIFFKFLVSSGNSISMRELYPRHLLRPIWIKIISEIERLLLIISSLMCTHNVSSSSPSFAYIFISIHRCTHYKKILASPLMHVYA